MDILCWYNVKYVQISKNWVWKNWKWCLLHRNPFSVHYNLPTLTDGIFFLVQNICSFLFDLKQPTYMTLPAERRILRVEDKVQHHLSFVVCVTLHPFHAVILLWFCSNSETPVHYFKHFHKVLLLTYLNKNKK